MQRIPIRQSSFALREAQLKAMFLQGLVGDAMAYRDFLKILSRHLRAYLRRRLYRWPDDVEDLVQETLLAVHNQRHTYRADQPLTPWVYAIARYKFVDFLRARSIREDLNEPLDDELLLFAQSHFEPLEAKRDIDKLLQQLPDRQRLPIIYVKLEGLSVMETAVRTGMSESAIKVGIHRGLKALAEKLRGYK
jgi:RNA polymerase sigma-70 factor, ECF subfamily